MMSAFEELRQRIDNKERELLQRCEDLQVDFLHELDQTTRLVKGRQTNMCNAINELQMAIQNSDEA